MHDNTQNWESLEIKILAFIDSNVEASKGVYVCTQSCLTLCNPVDCSSPVSSVQRIFQAGILEQGAISYSRGSSWLRDWACVSRISCIGRRVLYHCIMAVGRGMQIGSRWANAQGLPHVVMTSRNKGTQEKACVLAGKTDVFGGILNLSHSQGYPKRLVVGSAPG